MSGPALWVPPGWRAAMADLERMAPVKAETRTGAAGTATDGADGRGVRMTLAAKLGAICPRATDSRRSVRLAAVAASSWRWVEEGGGGGSKAPPDGAKSPAAGGGAPPPGRPPGGTDDGGGSSPDPPL